MSAENETENEANGNAKHFRSADFPSGPFRAHGNFDSVLAGRILRTKASGPFNEEITVMADKARRTIFAKFGCEQPFAVITVVQISVMCPPAALQLLAQLLKALGPDDIPLPAAVAWVIGDEVEGKSMMTPHYTRAFADAGIVFKDFTEEALAEEWVQRRLTDCGLHTRS